MAERPVFFPVIEKAPNVKVVNLNFPWVAGLSVSQKQKNIESFHSKVISGGIGKKPLEISSKSPISYGVMLSAFNLGADSPKVGGWVNVESLYQGSKVFNTGGPFPEVYTKTPIEARKRIKEHLADNPDGIGRLIGFNLNGDVWPLTPPFAFYTWLYCVMLERNTFLCQELDGYDCFTDIEFNPRKSYNCQAYAAAYYVALRKSQKTEVLREGRDVFLSLFPSCNPSELFFPGKTESPEVSCLCNLNLEGIE